MSAMGLAMTSSPISSPACERATSSAGPGITWAPKKILGVEVSGPPEYQGDGFAAQHGSWNRAKRTGYKVIRVRRLKDGAPTGEYEDFMTGFVINDSSVWGRPVGVTVAHDGALLVSEDGNGTIWRISYRGE